MKHLFAIPLILFTITLPLAAAEIEDREIIPLGTPIQVSAGELVDVATADRGRMYPVDVESDVYSSDGDLVIPRGTYGEMIVRQVNPGRLTLDLESITVNGQRYALDTAGPDFNINQEPYNSSAGIFGNIMGPAPGTQGTVIYEGDRFRVPSESRIEFHLQQPLCIVTWRDEGYSCCHNYNHERHHVWHRYERYHEWYRYERYHEWHH
jgi:hypothetical protein